MKAIPIVVALLTLSLCSCPTPDSGGGEDFTEDPGNTEEAEGGYPPASKVVSGVFAAIDSEVHTYYDVALPELPQLVTDTDDPALSELKDAFDAFCAFLESPAGSGLSGSSLSASRVASSVRALDVTLPTPIHYTFGDQSIWIYQWQEGQATITIVDTRSPVSYQTDCFYKGRAAGMDFPGDLSDPDDWGYLLDHHVYTVDARSGMSQSMFEPGLCDECHEMPWAEFTFDVSEAITIATPWGSDLTATYTYSSTVYACEPIYPPGSPDRYHISVAIETERKPNGDLATDIFAYSYTYHAPYIKTHYFYDESENSITWTRYDENGNITDHDTIP